MYRYIQICIYIYFSDIYKRIYLSIYLSFYLSIYIYIYIGERKSRLKNIDRSFFCDRAFLL